VISHKNKDCKNKIDKMVGRTGETKIIFKEAQLMAWTTHIVTNHGTTRVTASNRKNEPLEYFK
jgi:hypothetical protein